MPCIAATRVEHDLNAQVIVHSYCRIQQTVCRRVIHQQARKAVGVDRVRVVVQK
jgi:hypothetical protein